MWTVRTRSGSDEPIGESDHVEDGEPPNEAQGHVAARSSELIGDVAGFIFVASIVGFALFRAPATATMFLSALGLTWFLVPPVAVLARRLGALSLPGGRSVTLRSTELLGGAAVFFPILITLGLLITVTGSSEALGMAGGATLLFLLGAWDDVRGVRARTKVLVQLLAGACLVLAGFRLEALGILPGLAPVPLGVLEVPLILMWIVLASNAFNLIDGMDGLATSIAVLAAFTLALLGAMPLAALVVAGAAIGFLRHNLPRATIFLGDCGSLVFGFLIAALVLKAPPNANVPIAIGVMAYPLGDVAVAVVRRFLRGKPVLVGDRSHVHHKMMEYLGGAGPALLALVIFAAIPMLMLLWNPGLISITLTAVLWGIVVVALVRIGQVKIRHLRSDKCPLQQMYVMRDYVERTMQVTQDDKDIRRVLRHMAEALSLVSIDLPGMHLRLHREVVHGGRRHVVPLGDAVAEWTAKPLDHSDSGVLEEEREIVVTDLIRQAAGRLRSLGGGQDTHREATAAGRGLAASFGGESARVPRTGILRPVRRATGQVGRTTVHDRD